MPENPFHALKLEATPQDFARLFKTPPKMAIEAWEKRVLAPKPSRPEQANAAKGIPNPKLPWKSTDVMWHGHSRGFFVARMTRGDVLADIHSEVDRALKEGRTFEQFRRDLKPMLKAKGWWSGDEPDQKSLVRNPQTGQDEWARLGTTRRLKTIYQTNQRVAYAAGDYKAMDSVSDLLPYQEYRTLGHGPNRRQAHQLLHGRVFRADDPALSSIRPPNGWGCQCRMRAMTEGMARRVGALPEPSKVVSKTVEVDGKPIVVRGVVTPGGVAYPDPQWAYDVAEHGKAVEDLAWSKISKLPQPAQRTFVESIAKDPALLEQRTRHWSAWSSGVAESGLSAGKESVSVGWMPENVWTAMQGKKAHDLEAQSPVLLATPKSVLHSLRPKKDSKQALSKAQMQNLPWMLANATEWRWDGKLLAYSRLSADEWIRVVFDIDRGSLVMDTAAKVQRSALTGEVLR